MSRPSMRLSRFIAAMAIPVSVLGAGGVVWHSSYAAFSAETRNSGNSWGTGTVALTDDDSGTARFNVTSLVPGQTDTRCIRVTATSSVAGTVKLYIVNPVTSTAALENHIVLTVRQGDGGTFASCTGFVADSTIISAQTLAAATAAHSTYATAAGSWVTTGDIAGEVKTYEFAWTFDATGLTQEQLDGLQGSHTGLDFEWEIQNN